MTAIFNPTDKRIFNQAKALGLSDAVALNVVAQARLESADYSSNVYRQNNNAFGYKYVGQRIATQGTPVPGSETGGNNPKYYARYKSIEDSTTEIIQWILRRIKGGQFTMSELQTPAGYAAAIRRPPFQYYGSSLASYSAGMVAKAKLISGNSIATGAGGLGIAAIIFATFLLIK